MAFLKIKAYLYLIETFFIVKEKEKVMMVSKEAIKTMASRASALQSTENYQTLYVIKIKKESRADLLYPLMGDPFIFFRGSTFHLNRKRRHGPAIFFDGDNINTR